LHEQEYAMNEPIDKLARIAHLNLTKEERERFARELDSILKAFAILEKAPTKGIRSALHPVSLKPVQREDKAGKSLDRGVALANTPHKEDWFVRGPKVK
jgi:aspartyl-tRNA(Asn)/glutamyl-tRNA(Gln) amidotransferase subunit C